MSWLLLTCGVLGLGVVGLWTNARRAQACHDERAHYRLSVRFWTVLAGMGLVVPLLLLAPLASWGLFETLAARTAAVLTMIPPTVLVGAGAVNALSLGRTMRRRERALAAGAVTRGVVVDRRRRALSHDLMAVEIEVELPRPALSGQAPYRPVDPAPTHRVRLTELCPVDSWDRLHPGAEVELAYDPEDHTRYALLVFGQAGESAEPARLGGGSQLALEGPAQGIEHE